MFPHSNLLLAVKAQLIPSGLPKQARSCLSLTNPSQTVLVWVVNSLSNSLGVWHAINLGIWTKFQVSVHCHPLSKPCRWWVYPRGRFKPWPTLLWDCSSMAPGFLCAQPVEDSAACWQVFTLNCAALHCTAFVESCWAPFSILRT